MVHLRINEREPNPNPHVNFITILPMGDATVEEAGRQLLRALAAQVKPIMKTHGFVVNSLEEYEYNTVFAGRNWNNGETIELVLRSSTRSLLPTHWLLSTLCHELAHIKHMNHGSAFQALWRQLQQEVRALQGGGYYGDGYWSSGTRLADSTKVAGQGIEVGEFPEYMCGGAHSKARPVARRTRRSRDSQTLKKRKAGSRANASLFTSVGKALNEDLEGEKKLHGTGFRKKVGSKRAREERALAAEQRIQAFKASSALPTPSDIHSDSEDEGRVSETDNDRRRTLLEVIDENDLRALKATALDATQDFLLPSIGSATVFEDACGASTAAGAFGVASNPTPCGSGRIKTIPGDATSARPKKKRKILQSQLDFTSHNNFAVMATTKSENPWDCMVCTLTNKPNHLTCSACGTLRGEVKWSGDQ